MIKQLIADIQKGLASGVISAKFHNTVAAGLLEMAKASSEKQKVKYGCVKRRRVLQSVFDESAG